MNLIRVTDIRDPQLTDYTDLKDVNLRSAREPAEGLYMAESFNVIERALQAGHLPRSILLADKWLPVLNSRLETDWDIPVDTPIFVGPDAVVSELTGFHLHRGALAAMHRPAEVDPAVIVSDPEVRRIAILEGIVDHTNVGAIFRSAAGLGIDAVVVAPHAADPLYRRSVRVSMGAVFQVPWARFATWPGGIDLLRDHGFVVAALALNDNAISLDELAAHPPERLAIVLGAEGHGLTPETIVAADLTVRIPMAHGVDSLNVGAAAAVAFYAIR
ncbi:MAG: RNA methyltransferase [Promicromonosporaceae bacterium]|nr:RNA methyltransferase [Promicromonosporaceae bacterium]